jgi:hypothetical protein
MTKTLQDCKDEVARSGGYINWAHFSTDVYAYQENVLRHLDTAAELYAKSHSTELLERLEKEIQAKINVNNGAVQRSVTRDFTLREILDLLSTIKPK